MIVILGPRRTGTTTLFTLARVRPVKKTLCQPRSFFDILVMRLHLRRYGHYICPDIVHDRCSINCLIRWKTFLDNVEFVVLIRDEQELLSSQKKLADRFSADSDKADLHAQLDQVRQNVLLLESNNFKVKKLDAIKLMRQANISHLVEELPFIDHNARIVVTNAGADLRRRPTWQRVFVPLYQRLFTLIGAFRRDRS